MIIEVFALLEVLSQHDSICIQAKEISSKAQIFIVLLSMLIVPDLVTSLLTILDIKSIVRRLGPFYQLISMLICFTASFFLLTGITNCGNLAQDNFKSAVILATIAGTIHFIFGILVLMQMPKNMQWSISSPFNTNVQ
ncbi:uncharacterized protein LOC129947782 isoform X2 [Eupeodes corollae]|uniref:uncharacterized protein LOC129947782 isoform X2 n=1 Tax=Eupeodes corollae TaxID=290404 RepID=UPI0024936015|nr:uncharacterized protein LOC129947782 isoform X2 [Eupeodes corollae]